MNKKEITCIGCPVGCSLEVSISVGNKITVQGNECKRGEIYGIKECTNPTRIVTSTVRVLGGKEDIVSVKTERDIPKNLIFECTRELKNIRIKAPVNIGDTILSNVLNTGVNIIATKRVDIKS